LSASNESNASDNKGTTNGIYLTCVNETVLTTSSDAVVLRSSYDSSIHGEIVKEEVSKYTTVYSELFQIGRDLVSVHTIFDPDDNLDDLPPVEPLLELPNEPSLADIVDEEEQSRVIAEYENEKQRVIKANKLRRIAEETKRINEINRMNDELNKLLAMYNTHSRKIPGDMFEFIHNHVGEHTLDANGDLIDTSTVSLVYDKRCKGTEERLFKILYNGRNVRKLFNIVNSNQGCPLQKVIANILLCRYLDISYGEGRWLI
jgi:hypothetical protein